MALIALGGLSLAGAAMMRTAETGVIVAGNIGFHEAAVHASDRAIEAALVSLQTFGASSSAQTDSNANGYYATFVAGTRAPGTARLSDVSGSEVGRLVTDETSGNSMRYVIERLCNDATAASSAHCVMNGTQPVYRITSLIRGPRNTSETVQAVVSVDGYTLACAIITRDRLTMPGNPDVRGTNCVHSETEVDITGEAIRLGPVSATGAVGNASKITAAGGQVLANQPSRGLPTVNVANYRQYANYVLKADGFVETRDLAAGTSTTSGTAYIDSSTRWNEWYRSSASPQVVWEFNATTTSPGGMYYVDGNVVISTCPTSPDWFISIIATGSIEIAGNCSFADYKRNNTAQVPAAVDNIFLLAMGDIKLPGNSSTSPLQGSIIANEELQISGVWNISGNLLALNSNAADPAVAQDLVSENLISGDIVLTYNPNADFNLWPATVERLQWRSVKR
jgi:type IV pilus assembly protein PilX